MDQTTTDPISAIAAAEESARALHDDGRCAESEFSCSHCEDEDGEALLVRRPSGMADEQWAQVTGLVGAAVDGTLASRLACAMAGTDRLIAMFEARIAEEPIDLLPVAVGR